MIHILGFLLALVIAAVTGFGTTYLAVERGHGFEERGAGPWTSWPKAGSPDADPYAKAVIARTGQIPLNPGEGLVLEARTDSAGTKLRGRCRYAVAGDLPPARFWTLAAYEPNGTFRDNPAHRYGFTSSEIVRRSDGSFVIAVGADVEPGNWLPVAKDQDVVLIFRLYDTPLAAGAARLEDKSVPAIKLEGCR